MKLILTIFILTFSVCALAEEGSSPSPTATPMGGVAIPAQQQVVPNNGGTLVSVTRAVGEVGSHIVTSRETKIDVGIDQALNGKGEGQIPSGVEKTFPAQVSHLLDQWTVYFEAEALSSPPPAKSEVANNIRRVQDFWSHKSAWTELEVSADELHDAIEHKMIAKAFEALKSEPSLTPVSDDDALAYFSKNRLKFGSLPFENFKDSIKLFLVKVQTDRRLNEWHDVLRRKYKVRNFIAG